MSFPLQPLGNDLQTLKANYFTDLLSSAKDDPCAGMYKIMCCGYTAPDRQYWHTVTDCTQSVQLHSYWGGCLVKLDGRVLNFG